MTIKELRESKGLSQGKFAESIGIGRTAIVGYEKGKFKPSVEVAAKIKEVYGVDIAAPAEEAKPATPAEEAAPKKKGSRKKEEAPVEAKPVKRGKKKAAPVEEEKVEQPAPKKRGSRKKAAPTVEEQVAPAAEQPAPTAVEETNIAAAIKALRMGKGLSQKAFGESIGVKLPTVGAYEQGRIKPSEAVMAKIKDVYGALETAPAAEQPAIKQPAPKKGGRKKAVAPTAALEEVKPKKRTRKGEEAKPAEEKKPAKRGGAKKDGGVLVVIQSPMGGSITQEEILAKVGPVDAVYVRVDENKAYWVKGDETGSVDLW